MTKTESLSNSSLPPNPRGTKTPSEYLAAFKQTLSSFIRAWAKYQPNDSLAAQRKEDLDWLKSTLHDYRLNIHISSKCREFWKGCLKGKHSRRMLSDQNSQSGVPILVNVLTNTKSQPIYELGFQVGWRYVRLKDYLLRIRKERKLAKTQQLQDYQQFLNLLRTQEQAEEMDSVLSFGWIRERKPWK